MKPERIVVIGTDYPELETYCPHWNGIKKGLERLEVPYKFVSCRPHLNTKEVIEFQPDLVVYGLKDMILRSDWRKEIREELPHAKIVIWYGDYRNERTTQINADCSEVDAMFISNDAQKTYYQQKWKVPEVYFLPLASEPIDKPIMDDRFKFDWVFIGSEILDGAFHKRASYVGNLKIDYGLKVINSFEPQMRARIFKAMPAIYSSSKICLDISHFTDVDKYTSIRFWEIPAFYGFALTKRFPGCEEFYPEGTRVYFDTLHEAVEKKEYYLSHEKERLEIAERAHKHSYNHTYDKRFLTMFELL